MSPRLHIRVQPGMLEDLKLVSRKEGKRVSFLARELIEEGLRGRVTTQVSRSWGARTGDHSGSDENNSMSLAEAYRGYCASVGERMLGA